MNLVEEITRTLKETNQAQLLEAHGPSLEMLATRKDAPFLLTKSRSRGILHATWELVGSFGLDTFPEGKINPSKPLSSLKLAPSEYYQSLWFAYNQALHEAVRYYQAGQIGPSSDASGMALLLLKRLMGGKRIKSFEAMTPEDNKIPVLITLSAVGLRIDKQSKIVTEAGCGYIHVTRMPFQITEISEPEIIAGENTAIFQTEKGGKTLQ